MAERKKFEIDFKASARQITVNLDECEIKHKEHVKEEVINKGKRHEGREKIRVSECRIHFRHKENGGETTYISPGLYIELINLSIYLYQQKTTTPYIDNVGSEQFVDEKGRIFFMPRRCR